jgi:Ca-activated chloride channel family protein
VVALAAGSAQEPATRFSAGVQLVEVYATVTDARGEPVTGLGQDDFEVYEDGRRQEVTAFAAGEVPLTVVVGVDRSWSMAGEPLQLSTRATEAFLGALDPGDRSMVVAIGSDVEVIAPLSRDREAQRRAVAGLEPWSTTALHDAIVGALDRLETEPGRRALVVFSDGVDRYSQTSAAQVLDRARDSQVLVYPITLGRTRPPLAAELAVLTGGRSFLLRDARALEATFTAIARELRYQYLLGYASPETDGPPGRRWRSIRVAIAGDRPALRVRARDGYYAD